MITFSYQREARMFTIQDIIAAATARGLRCSMDVVCEATASGELVATRAPPLVFPEATVNAWLQVLATRQGRTL